MTKHQVGDTVRVTQDNTWSTPFNEGDEVKITDAHDRSAWDAEDSYTVHKDGSGTWFLPESAVEALVEEFKVGDTVKLKYGSLHQEVVGVHDDQVWVVFNPETEDGTSVYSSYKATRLIKVAVAWEKGVEYTPATYESKIKFRVEFVDEDGGAYIKYTHGSGMGYGQRHADERNDYKEVTA